MFKLVGNFEMLQSAPYASISVAISDCLPKKKQQLENVFYEIVGSILSYNNIWEYFWAILWLVFNKCRVTLWLVLSQDCTELNPVIAFFFTPQTCSVYGGNSPYIYNIYNHDNSIDMIGHSWLEHRRTDRCVFVRDRWTVSSLEKNHDGVCSGLPGYNSCTGQPEIVADTSIAQCSQSVKAKIA